MFSSLASISVVFQSYAGNERRLNGMYPFKQWEKLFDFDKEAKYFCGVALECFPIDSIYFSFVALEIETALVMDSEIFQEKSKADEVDDSFSM